MEKEKNEGGGQAFPTNSTWGMSLRDYYAGKALRIILLKPSKFITGPYNPDDVAARAYEFADAMIKARG